RREYGLYSSGLLKTQLLTFTRIIFKKGMVMRNMRNMRNIKNRSGTSQEDRALKALHPDYVSVEERSLVDLLAYLREYAGRVRFYEKEDWSDEFWSEFLSFT